VISIKLAILIYFDCAPAISIAILIISKEKSTLHQIPTPPDHFAQVEAILSKTWM
jgi:hypothetical protein